MLRSIQSVSFLVDAGPGASRGTSATGQASEESSLTILEGLPSAKRTKSALCTAALRLYPARIGLGLVLMLPDSYRA